jgi:photosystem II stability/assembly factor-like uncharacterized protein
MIALVVLGICGCGDGGSHADPSATAIVAVTASATPSSTPTPLDGFAAWTIDAHHVARSTDGGRAWKTVLSTGDAIELRGVAFADRRRGWVVGGSEFGFGAALLRTDDGGETWNDQLPNVTGVRDGSTRPFGFFAVACTDALHAVAVGSQQQSGAVFAPPALVVVTDDGGRTWRSAAIHGTPRRGNLHAVCLDQNGLGVAVGHPYQGGAVILVTADGGATWQAVDEASGLYAGGDLATITSAACAEPSSFWISGTNLGPYTGGSYANVVHSPNGGADWFLRFESLLGGFIGAAPLSFVDTTHGWMLAPVTRNDDDAASSNLRSTVDAGITWTRVDLPDDRPYAALAFVDFDRGLLVGAGTLATMDGGRSWTAADLPDGIVGRAVALVP